MRAHEFITESIGKIGTRRQQSTRGLHKFRDSNMADRTYELNRVMMAAACTDGELVPVLDNESWSGRYNTAHPYTEVEQNMMIKAYQAVGTDYRDMNHGDLKSKELDSTNSKSPVKAFKGY